jgi:hypothetical protein
MEVPQEVPLILRDPVQVVQDHERDNSHEKIPLKKRYAPDLGLTDLVEILHAK